MTDSGKKKILEIRHFIRNSRELPYRIFKAYRNYQVLSEADLQALVTFELRRFLASDIKRGRLTVHNCLYFKGIRIFPDIVIQRKGKPWIVIELKESGRLEAEVAEKERAKISRLQKKLSKNGIRIQNAFLIYVEREGLHRKLESKRKHSGFFEVPITLQKYGMNPQEIKEFRRQFRQLSRHRCD